MTDFATLRLPLSERLPIVTYTNLLWPVAATVWMSPQTERITGYPVAEWVGNPGFFESVLHPGDRRAVLEEAHASRRDKRAFSADYRILAPDGRVIWIHDESVPIGDDGGRLELLQGYFVDITARKELEQQLLHSQKTEELGRLAGQISQDFDNLLVAIRCDAELLSRRLSVDTAEHGYAQEVTRTAERARQLTRQLLAFARRRHFEPSDISLPDVVDCLGSVLRRVAGETVELDFELEPAPLVHADVGRIEQVLVNLVANARDAMPDGGLVCVGTHSTTLRSERAERFGLPVGDYAVLAVSDTGAGMDEQTQASIFEPFFTTKDDDRGAGLGLAIVESIVRQAGGAVELESSPGNGTRVRIYLPAVTD